MNMRDLRSADRSAKTSFRLQPMARSVRLALLPGLIAGLGGESALAAPSGGQVRAGSGHISHNSSHSITTIDQHSQRLALDWRNFDEIGRAHV